MSSKPKQVVLTSFQLWVLYINITLYALCYMAQAPVLPYLTKSLGADAAGYGALQTVFSAVQVVGGLWSGPLVDKYGGKNLLLMSFGASAISYGLTATANSMWLLYISRIPTILQQAVLAARTIVTAASTDEERARVIGYVGVAYGVGFAVGPALGGYISQISLQLAAWFATAGSILSIVLIATLLPSDSPARKAPVAGEGKAKPSLTWNAFKEVCVQPAVPQLLVAKTLAGMAGAMFSSVFSLALEQKFKLNSRDNGLLLSYVGVVVIAVQALLVGPAERLLGEWGCVRACTALLLVAFTGLVAVEQVWQLMALLLPMSGAATLFSTVNTAQLTKAVPPQLRGTMLAVDMSLGSGVRMLAPMAAGLLLQQAGFPSLGASAAALTALLLLLLASPWMRAVQGAPDAKGAKLHAS